MGGASDHCQEGRLACAKAAPKDITHLNDVYIMAVPIKRRVLVSPLEGLASPLSHSFALLNVSLFAVCLY